MPVDSGVQQYRSRDLALAGQRACSSRGNSCAKPMQPKCIAPLSLQAIRRLEGQLESSTLTSPKVRLTWELQNIRHNSSNRASGQLPGPRFTPDSGITA